MFWNKKAKNGNVAAAKTEKLPGPKDIVGMAGSYMVVSMKKEPDWVWKLKSVVRPVSKKTFYCRVFDDNKTREAGVTVKDWSSLDEYPELILWEGYCDKETGEVQTRKFAET
jgi:hypothetical protein